MPGFVTLVCVHRAQETRLSCGLRAGTGDLGHILLLANTHTHSHAHERSTPGEQAAEREGKQPASRGLVREPPVKFHRSKEFYGFTHTFRKWVSKYVTGSSCDAPAIALRVSASRAANRGLGEHIEARAARVPVSLDNRSEATIRRGS
jgi:hypothetical protein